MSMNTINSLRMVLIYAVEFLDIIPNTSETDADIAAISQMIAAYDALAPDWSQAPEWAQWCAVVPGGRALWSETPLVLLPEGDGWTDEDAIGLWSWAEWIVDLPLGIDWRLLKWQRPEVAA